MTVDTTLKMKDKIIFNRILITNKSNIDIQKNATAYSCLLQETNNFMWLWHGYIHTT